VWISVKQKGSQNFIFTANMESGVYIQYEYKF